MAKIRRNRVELISLRAETVKLRKELAAARRKIADLTKRGTSGDRS